MRLLEFARLSFLAASPLVAQGSGSPNVLPKAQSAAAAQTQAIVSPASPPVMLIEVDATQVRRRLIHSHVQIPVSGRSVTVSYPLWNPGDHAPIQDVGRIAELAFHAVGQVLPWKRDLVDLNAFHVSLPPGVQRIDADFEFLLPAPGDAFADSSQHLLMLRWNLYTLYVAGKSVRQLPVVASVKLPGGWAFATALPVERQDEDTVHFQQASLETVIDSPVLTGQFLRKIDLTPGERPGHEMDIAAESEAGLPSRPKVLEAFGPLIEQARLMFASEPYRSYRFLVAVSDYTMPGSGFEHSESSDNRVAANFFSKTADDILPHELVHSWNGKYRRPADLYPKDYQRAEKTDLLWVYESLTDYLGVVLSSRSGAWTTDYSRERWAAIAARVDHETGRTWRSMQDTANSVPLTMNELFFANPGWNSWLRMLDYYDEGALLWLEANEIIVDQTHGQRSLENFLRRFYAADPLNSVVRTGASIVKTYTRQDVVAALTKVAPYNWNGFFEERLNSLTPHAPLGGLERSGWKLVYTPEPNKIVAGQSGLGGLMDSMGLALGGDGTVVDILRGGVCDAAGMVPGMKIVSLNGDDWAAAKMILAVAGSANSPVPLRLTTEFAGTQQQFLIDYHGGARYPHLERIKGRPDRLTLLMEPLHSGKS